MAYISQYVLDRCLGDYYKQGFRACESEDILELYFKDKLVARFNATALTVIKLHEKCAEFLENLTPAEMAVR